MHKLTLWLLQAALEKAIQEHNASGSKDKVTQMLLEQALFQQASMIQMALTQLAEEAYKTRVRYFCQDLTSEPFRLYIRLNFQLHVSHVSASNISINSATVILTIFCSKLVLS